MKMTSNKFILSKPEFDFFFNPKGNIKSLVCGNLESGIFKSYRSFEFDKSGSIKSEIGYQVDGLHILQEQLRLYQFNT